MLLTTHYMDEAERLCDRVGVVDKGKVIALGTPRELIASLGGEQVVEFATRRAARRARRWRALPRRARARAASADGVRAHRRASCTWRCRRCSRTWRSAARR